MHGAEGGRSCYNRRKDSNQVEIKALQRGVGQSKADTHTTRNPRSMLRLSGESIHPDRYAQRLQSAWYHHEPPRTTR